MMPGNNPFFPKLFSPGRIGEMEVRNRIIMPPMGTGHGSTEGYVTEKLTGYYEARAKGGVGLVIIEVTCVDAATGMDMPGRLVVDDDKFVPGLSQLAEAIHRHGAKAALQLHHGGRVAKSALTGRQPVAPSAIPMPSSGWAWENPEIPRELTVSEIKNLVGKYSWAAQRARKAGFDAVDIHAQGLYLPAQFLSATSNKRQDEYGGELRNRARFLLEIIKAVKESAGQDFPVIVRLSYVEFGIEGGFTFDECLQVAQMAQQAGADAVRGYIAGWGMPDLSLVKDPAEIQAFLSLSMEEPPNSQAFFTDRIKKRVTIPVIAGSRITPEIGEMMLQENRADFIAIGRGLITDPDWAHKAASGRTDEIVPCIACMRCINSALTEANMQCSVNPAVSREREYEIKPAAKKKKVIVVGGGPGGMEAARVAALKGHRVTLYEKQPQLGGQLLLATVPPHKDNLAPLAGYLSTQMEKRGVKVNVGVEATPELIKKAKPDAVILATGASPIVPDIPGIGRSNVITAEQVLEGQPVGEKVVVIGAELVGCETADFLAEKGKKVTITRRGPKMATRIGPGVREMLLGRLAALGVNMLTGVEYERITDKGLAITTKDGAKQTIEADTIVLAAGARPNRELLKALEGKVPEVYNIGDSAEPRKIADAITEGYRVALKL